ncbi:hypothetical protein [Streptacidiphilus anmyonensis]|uniref:hypothetical protein n=1 Tax=Streptacidiphilus anmyonensis TaxID=405782 RepID=UPI0005AA042F|nr:hypothetical protein [Streptacidiphilus anmyonensis]
MPTDPKTHPCPVAHYALGAPCTLTADHHDAWHQTVHPDTGQLLRFRTDRGALHTQEWEPDHDPGAPDAGTWVTWHYVTPQVDPTPTVPDDLDQRADTFVSNHSPSGLTRIGQTGIEAECGCGAWYPNGRHSTHLGREVSLLARGYFDLALRRSGAAPQAS